MITFEWFTGTVFRFNRRFYFFFFAKKVWNFQIRKTSQNYIDDSKRQVVAFYIWNNNGECQQNDGLKRSKMGSDDSPRKIWKVLKRNGIVTFWRRVCSSICLKKIKKSDNDERHASFPSFRIVVNFYQFQYSEIQRNLFFTNGTRPRCTPKSLYYFKLRIWKSTAVGRSSTEDERDQYRYLLPTRIHGKGGNNLHESESNVFKMIIRFERKKNSMFYRSARRASKIITR